MLLPVGVDKAQLKALRILIVDDFANARRSLRNIMLKLGVEQVVEANSSEEAVRHLQLRTFDIILCDYNLGDGATGLQLFQMHRHRRSVSFHTQWVIITAETAREVFLAAMESEPDDFLSKPFSYDDMKTRLMKWLQRREVLKPVFQALDDDDPEAVSRESLPLEEKYPRYRSWLRKTRVRMLLRHGRLEEAEAAIQVIIARRDQDWALIELARIQRARGNTGETRRTLDRALAVNPANTLALDQMATCFRDLGQPQRAQATLLQAVRIAPINVKRQRQLGHVSRELRHFKIAVKAYKDILSLVKGSYLDSPVHFLNAIEALNSAARMGFDEDFRNAPRQSVELASRMLRRFPKSVMVEMRGLQLQAEAMHLQGRRTDRDNLLLGAYRTGIDNFERIDDTMVKRMAAVLFDLENQRLGNRWLDAVKGARGENAALESSLESLREDPPEQRRRRAAARHNSGGNKAYREGRYHDAVASFLEALELSPGHIGLVLNIAQAQLRLFEQIKDPVYAEEAERFIGYASGIPESHAQFDRLDTLKAWLGRVQRQQAEESRE